MIVFLWLVKSAEQVIRRYPAIQTLCLSWNDLHVHIAIGQLKLSGSERKLTDFLQHFFPLSLREYAHARCRKQE